MKKIESKNDFEKKKAETIQFLEKVASKLGIKRDELINVLDISKPSLYGYMTRGEIPDKQRRKLDHLLEHGTLPQLGLNNSDTTETEQSIVNKNDLSKVPLDDLIAEIEKRNWSVEIKRKS